MMDKFRELGASRATRRDSRKPLERNWLIF